jgi:hypothetical protein
MTPTTQASIEANIATMDEAPYDPFSKDAEDQMRILMKALKRRRISSIKGKHPSNLTPKKKKRKK